MAIKYSTDTNISVGSLSNPKNGYLRITDMLDMKENLISKKISMYVICGPHLRLNIMQEFALPSSFSLY